MNRRLLLLSNSKTHGRGYLEHALDEIGGFLGEIKAVAFVPFALKDREGYGALVKEHLAALGLTTTTVTDDAFGLQLLETTRAVFVGGGNTFRLLDVLQQSGLLGVLRRRVPRGLPYIGSSAGTNLACPTIKTTNDMPIVHPRSLEAIGAVAFQINPHYVDPDPGSPHMGETREQRINEFHEENAEDVVALREGSWLRVDGGRGTLGGLTPARIFRRGQPPEERSPGASFDDLLAG